MRFFYGACEALGGAGYPGVEPQGYISGGTPLACVLCDGLFGLFGPFGRVGRVVLGGPRGGGTRVFSHESY